MSTTQESAFKLYLNEVAKINLLSADEERELFRKVRDGDEEAREQFIKANLRMVIRIARSYENCGLPLLDLISEGNIGLMRAVEGFDPDYGNRFYTYAKGWIKSLIRKALDSKSRIIRLPSQKYQDISQINRTSERLQEELGRRPLLEEIAYEVSMPEEKISRLMKISTNTISLDAYISDNDDSQTFMELVSDSSVDDPSTQTEQDDMISLTKKLFTRLTKKEQAVLKIRYGLNGGDHETLDVVGKHFKLSRERVRQIQHKALEKLRGMIDSHYVHKIAMK